eukprot:605-Rhodomonas_salina.1
MSVPGRTHGCSALASSSERRSFFLVSFRDGTDCYCDWSVATYGTPMRTQHIYESLHSDFVMNKTCTTNRGIFRCHLAQHAFAMLCSWPGGVQACRPSNGTSRPKSVSNVFSDNAFWGWRSSTMSLHVRRLPETNNAKNEHLRV